MTDALTIDVTAVEVLTAHEQKTKERCDKIIQAGKKHFRRTMRALARYNRLRLYRAEHKTFEAFVLAQFGISRSRAYQLITASLLSTQVDIQNERQARELKRLPETVRPLAWDMAKHMAAVVAPGQPIPARIVKAAVNVLDTAKATGGYVDTGDGKMTALDAAVTQETHEITKRQQQHIATSIEAANGLSDDTKYTGKAAVVSVDKHRHFMTLIVPDDLLAGVEPGEIVTFAIYVKGKPACN